MRQRKFGELFGQDIYLVELTNNNGCSAEILSYGGILRSLKMPDKYGNFLDVVLGYDTIEAYSKDDASHGALIGRYGNRIAKGKITVDGKSYQLALNDNGINHLHGGEIGYSKRIWTIDDVTKQSVTLSLVDEHLTENYPGTVKVSVVYTLTDENELKIEYRAVTDRNTWFNPTNHTYFNLSGYHSGSIVDHILKLNADYYTPTDSDLIPTGEIRSVAGTPFDFRAGKPIGQDLNYEDTDLRNGNGYDHNFILGNAKTMKKDFCTVTDSKSGIVLVVSTDMPAVQLYIGNFLNGSLIGKGNLPITYRSGFCLETQYSPNTPNQPAFESCLLKKDEVFHSVTVYRFEIQA